MEKQLAARAVVEHEEQLVPRLEGHVETHDKGVLNVAQHVPLRLRVFHLHNVQGGVEKNEFRLCSKPEKKHIDTSTPKHTREGSVTRQIFLPKI